MIPSRAARFFAPTKSYNPRIVVPIPIAGPNTAATNGFLLLIWASIMYRVWFPTAFISGVNGRSGPDPRRAPDVKRPDSLQPVTTITRTEAVALAVSMAWPPNPRTELGL